MLNRFFKKPYPNHESAFNPEVLTRYFNGFEKVLTTYVKNGYDPILTFIKLGQKNFSAHLCDYYLSLIEILMPMLDSNNDLLTITRQLKSKGLSQRQIDGILAIFMKQQKSAQSEPSNE